MRRGLLVIGLIITIALVIQYCTALAVSYSHLLFPNKFRSDTNLRTSTRRYAFHSPTNSGDGYIRCADNCPWESYLSNTEFKSVVEYRVPFNIEDSQNVTAMRKQLACVPFSFGYSQTKAEELFPPYDYPSCASKPSEPRPQLHLDQDSGTFSMTCPNGEPGRYLLHPATVPVTNEYFLRDLTDHWEVKSFAGTTISNVSGEFALGSCGEDFTQAQLIPKFNSKVLNRAKDIMRKKAGSQPVRPLVILFLAVDSFSRRHFFRKLKKTVDLLNSLNQEEEFAVFDFKLHNIIGSHSPENMVPMFANETIKPHDPPRHRDELGRNSLWAIAKDWGYVTTIGFEYCGSNFVNYLGRKLEVDHHVSTFFCAAKAFMGLNMAKGAKEQRCIGPHMSHYYLLNYTQTLTRLYQGVNQFMYMHVEAAHEATGEHAATLDSDLADFLKSYIAEFDTLNDLVIIVQGDHGMAYGDWHKDVEAEQEYKLPAMFLLTQTRLLDRLPNSFDSLWFNSFHLVSKRDFRATLLSLLSMPYNTSYPVHKEEYLSNACILHQEKVKDSRVCNDTAIEPWFCSCLEPTEEIPSELIHSWGRGETENLLLTIVQEALQLINEKVFTSTKLSAGLICRSLTLDYIVRAYGYKLTRKMEQLKIEFTVQELDSARIEVIALIGSDEKHELFEKALDWNALSPYTYLGFETNIRVTDIQIIDVTRRDMYAGLCEKVSRANGLDGEFCVCNNLEEMKKDHPSLFPDE